MGMKAYIIIAVLLGFIAGQNLSVPVAHAQSNSDVNARATKALEEIAQTLKSIERKMK